MTEITNDGSLYMSLSDEDQRELIRKAIRSSENPVAGWEKFQDKRRDNMPSTKKITDFWSEFLQLTNKFDSHFEITDGPFCWACGFESSGLYRAHILPWQLGGSSDVSNLHMLCHTCHRISEDLWGSSYWEWFFSSLNPRGAFMIHASKYWLLRGVEGLSLSERDLAQMRETANIPTASPGDTSWVDSYLTDDLEED